MMPPHEAWVTEASLDRVIIFCYVRLNVCGLLFSVISRRFVIRARVGDDILDFCGLLIALATLPCLSYVCDGFAHCVDIV